MEDTGKVEEEKLQEIAQQKPNAVMTYSLAIVFGIILIGIFVLRYLDPEHTDATFMVAAVGAGVGITKFIRDHFDQTKTQTMLASAVSTTAAKIDKAEAKIDNNTNITAQAATAAQAAAIKTRDLSETVEYIGQAVNGAAEKRVEAAYVKGKAEGELLSAANALQIAENTERIARDAVYAREQFQILHEAISILLAEKGLKITDVPKTPNPKVS